MPPGAEQRVRLAGPNGDATRAGDGSGDQLTLVVRAAAHACALRFQDVVETMRPLPCNPVSDLPPSRRVLGADQWAAGGDRRSL